MNTTFRHILRIILWLVLFFLFLKWFNVIELRYLFGGLSLYFLGTSGYYFDCKIAGK
jgi:hypothetical protein